MPSASQAIATPTTDHVSFPRNDFSGEEILDVRTNFHDLTNEFVTDHHRYGNRLLCPGIPIVNVQIGSADPRFLHTDQAVVDTDFWEGDVLQFKTYSAMMLYQSFHSRVHREGVEAKGRRVLRDLTNCLTGKE
jgi:hypothetical protein